MKRRDFLAGGIALMGQQKLVHSLNALSTSGQVTRPTMPPQNLLSKPFTESFLTAHLIPIDQYHPS